MTLLLDDPHSHVNTRLIKNTVVNKSFKINIRNAITN